MTKDVLLWEKYRPTSFNNIILLPRIKNFLQHGVKTNMIFYGHPGVGKTSIARIISKNHHTLEIASSYHTSIDTLRNVVTDFVKTLNFEYDPTALKVVFLDEFERVSPSYQDALKGFVEEFSDTVRFILSTNHINKIHELGSRFSKINFNPINQEETEYLKNGYFKYLKAIIKAIQKEDLFNDDNINKIINKFFPDLRAAVELIDQIRISGDISGIETLSASSYYIDLYNFILNTSNEPEENYKYVMSNFQDNPESAFEVLGRPFFSYLLEMKPEIINKKGGSIIKEQKEYNETLSQTIDPLIHLISYISDLKQIING